MRDIVVQGACLLKTESMALIDARERIIRRLFRERPKIIFLYIKIILILVLHCVRLKRYATGLKGNA